MRRVNPKAAALAALLLMAGFASFAEAVLSAPSLTATPVSTSQVNLSWSDPNNNESGVQVERSLSSTTGFTVVATLAKNARSYSSTGLAASTTYYFRVKATAKGNGASPYSNVASARTLTGVAPTPTPAPGGTLPLAPSNLGASGVSSSQINLSWTDNSTNETAFKVERAAASAGPWAQIGTTAAASFASTGLAASTTYYFRVRAYNAYGDSAYSNTAGAATLSGTSTVPAAPTGASASAVSSSQINLAWGDTSSNESGFKIERGTATSGFVQIATVGANVTTYASTGLAASTTYYFRVRAYNTSGNSAYSNTASAATLSGTSTVPAAPTGASASAVSSSQINLAWTDTSSNESGFKIERSSATSGFAQIATVGVNVTSYASTGLAAGTAYSYRVRAYNTSGDSAYSNTASATTSSASGGGGTGAHIWSKDFGGTTLGVDFAVPAGIAVDGAGASVVVGYLKGTVNFGGSTLTSAGYGDIYLTKYSSTGTPVWAQRFGGTADDRPKGVALDANGNIYITGFFRGTAGFGGTALVATASASNAFLAKYSSAGAHLWSRRVTTGSTSIDTGIGIDVDGSGNVIIGASLFGTGDFGGGAMTSAGAEDVVLAKYSSAGGHIWSRRMGGTGADWLTKIAVDPTTGETVAAGYFAGTSNFGGTSFTSAGKNDAFVVKYSSAGGHVWSKRWGSSEEDKAFGVATDSLGNVAVTGQFTYSVDFGGGAVANAGDGASADVFLVKLSPTGITLFSKGFGSSLSLGEVGYGVGFDGSGNVLLTGTVAGTINFGGTSLTGDGYYNIFLAKFGSTGSHVWSKRYLGGGNHAAGRAVASDGSGNVLGTGEFGGSINLGGTVLASPGGDDMYLVKLGP